MKKILLLLSAIISVSTLFGQAPQKMSYQAVIRNSNSALVTNTAIGMRVSILQSSATGTAVYTETQKPTTNANGLASIEIGAGTIVTGAFSTIDWSKGPYFIKTETDIAGGANYSITGTSQLLSVPYALYAANGLPIGSMGQLLYNNGISWVGVSGGTTGQQLTYCNGVPTWGNCSSVTTSSATAISNSATINGLITNKGAEPVSPRVCFSKSPNTTIYNSTIINSVTYNSGSGAFSAIATNLVSNTIYYARAYTINTYGSVTYGNEITFTTTSTSLGQYYQGGYVFFLDSAGTHGLIADSISFWNPPLEWGCIGTSILTDSTFGSGSYNTTRIINSCSTSSIAAQRCKSWTKGGYSDWYLPSISELNLVYLQKIALNKILKNGIYWSSTQLNTNSAKTINFSTGEKKSDVKNNVNYVVAIRSF